MAEQRAIIWRFIGDERSLKKASREGKQDLGELEDAGGGATAALGGIKRAAAGLGLAVGAREVAEFALDAARMSEQAEIAGESLEKVLGPAADTLRTRLDETRQVLGFSKGEMDKMTASLGLMATGMGASREKAGELVATMIERGGDLAAFSGELGNASDAVGAIGGALRGEFDPLEQFGVKLNEAKIQAEIARRTGLDPMFASLSEGEQRLEAIIGLIEQGAAPALGALGKAAETTAGQTNQLNSEWKTFKEELGGPIDRQLKDSLGAILDLKGAIEELGEEGGHRGSELLELALAAGAVGSEAHDAFNALTPFNEALQWTRDRSIEGWMWLLRIEEGLERTGNKAAKSKDELAAWAQDGLPDPSVLGDMAGNLNDAAGATERMGEAARKQTDPLMRWADALGIAAANAAAYLRNTERYRLPSGEAVPELGLLPNAGEYILGSGSTSDRVSEDQRRGNG